MKTAIIIHHPLGKRVLRACIAVIALVCGAHGIEASAQGQSGSAQTTEQIQMVYVNADTCLYERADEESAVLLQLHAQDVVMQIETGSVWVKVRTGDVVGYVMSGYVQIENPDPAAAREFQQQEVYDAEFVNEVVRLTKEQRQSRIYGCLMILAIVGIFAAGIVSTVLPRRKRGAEKS